jgi:hypothetical protein
VNSNPNCLQLLVIKRVFNEKIRSADIETDDVPVSGVINMLSIALEFSLFLFSNINWNRENWFGITSGRVLY